MPRLNYHHLYYFWQVATRGNLTQVAQELHVSQSALSAQIRKLEDRLGTELFERTGRRLVLTEAGQRALAYANDIFSRGSELESLFREGYTAESRDLRIGVISTISRNFVDGFIEPLLRDDRSRFSLHARGLTNLLNGLTSHHFDLILSNTEVQVDSDNQFQVQLLARQPVSVVGPPGAPRPLEFPGDYAGYQWVLPGSRSAIRASFDAFCAIRQFHPVIKAEADDMAMLRLLARDSQGLAVVPPVVVQDELQRGDLEEYLVLPNVYENFYAITVKRQFSPPIVQQLLQRYTSANPTVP